MRETDGVDGSRLRAQTSVENEDKENISSGLDPGGDCAVEIKVRTSRLPARDGERLDLVALLGIRMAGDKIGIAIPALLGVGQAEGLQAILEPILGEELLITRAARDHLDPSAASAVHLQEDIDGVG